MLDVGNYADLMKKKKIKKITSQVQGNKKKLKRRGPEEEEQTMNPQQKSWN